MEELKDKYEEDPFFQKYREQRLKELKALASLPHFGKVIEITKQEYEDEVSKAPKDVQVLLHMYQPYLMECNLLNNILEKLAQKYPLIKFVKIIATKCVEKYPDDAVPTILIYKNSQKIQTLAPALPYIGGKNLNLKCKFYSAVEKGLINKNILPKGEEEEDEITHTLSKMKNNEDDLSDDDDDKEYSANYIHKIKK